MCAPSDNNRQLWHFVVIRDREMLRKVAEVHPYAKMAAGAAAAVIICADLNEEKTPGFWVQDCSAARHGLVRSAPHRGQGPAVPRDLPHAGEHPSPEPDRAWTYGSGIQGSGTLPR